MDFDTRYHDVSFFLLECSMAHETGCRCPDCKTALRGITGLNMVADAYRKLKEVQRKRDARLAMGLGETT